MFGFSQLNWAPHVSCKCQQDVIALEDQEWKISLNSELSVKMFQVIQKCIKNKHLDVSMKSIQ